MGDFDFTTTGFKVEGFAELHKNIEKLTQVQRSIGLSPLLEKSLTPMSHVAYALAADDPSTPPPWDLRTSVAVSTRQRSGPARSDRPLGQYEARAYMGPTKYGYPEAVFMEFGTTQRHWKKSGKSTGFQAPQPYMRPAWDAGKEGVLKIIREGYAEAVFKTARLFAVSPLR